ncbi:MAG: DUF1311 domain-containing protein, partial [Proteobacteria bacterium]|nr:DUF1311 domain-containing protein [Pseudomonadota bacterium]
LEPEPRAALVKAQRSWLAFRDAECGYVLVQEGGTLGLLMTSECWLQKIEERNVELERHLGQL